MEREGGRIWSIGHSNRDLDEFIAALEEAGIECVVDVRRRPTSRFERFSREPLAEALAELREVAGRLRTAFMCTERVPWRCDRMHIADALDERGWRVLHIIEAGRTWEASGGQRSMEL